MMNIECRISNGSGSRGERLRAKGKEQGGRERRMMNNECRMSNIERRMKNGAGGALIPQKAMTDQRSSAFRSAQSARILLSVCS